MCAQRCVRAAVLSGVALPARLDRGLDLHDTAVQLYLSMCTKVVARQLYNCTLISHRTWDMRVPFAIPYYSLFSNSLCPKVSPVRTVIL